MKNVNLDCEGLSELSSTEMKNLNGGFIWVVGIGVALVYQAALVGCLAAGLYGTFQTGYSTVQ